MTFEAKPAGEAAKPRTHRLLNICKSLIVGGVAGRVGILWLYEQQPGNEEAQLTPILRLGAGACAGIIAMSATYPMDMVRRRLTVQTEASPRQYRGIYHALSTVLREERPRASYKRWLPSVIGVLWQVMLRVNKWSQPSILLT
ncbi:hypothetical protein VIGAN_01446300 [Vigna angularis var. angularis]|uniref:Uncharacterized protein n=1 Tax=Vigna angularis var. angularis TaxID=157739 RepID=A0A0S3R766_PHAAN|nr:hypothetical protein VIGAN_01446300 [Vigna angularis var. angularis]